MCDARAVAADDPSPDGLIDFDFAEIRSRPGLI
jgi:hypothetical protein